MQLSLERDYPFLLSEQLLRKQAEGIFGLTDFLEEQILDKMGQWCNPEEAFLLSLKQDHSNHKTCIIFGGGQSPN